MHARIYFDRRPTRVRFRHCLSYKCQLAKLKVTTIEDYNGPRFGPQHSAALGLFHQQPQHLLGAGLQVRQEAPFRKRRLRRRLLRGVLQGTVSPAILLPTYVSN